MVHGLGLSGIEYIEQLNELVSKFDVYLVDLIGHGLSSPIDADKFVKKTSEGAAK